MSDILFTCTGCNQQIKIGEEWAGKTGNCPTCDKKLIVPFKVPFKKKEVVESKSVSYISSSKKCQYCKETVLQDAIKCKYCQSNLVSSHSVLVKKQSEGYGCGILIIILVFIIIAFFANFDGYNKSHPYKSETGHTYTVNSSMTPCGLTVNEIYFYSKRWGMDTTKVQLLFSSARESGTTKEELIEGLDEIKRLVDAQNRR